MNEAFAEWVDILLQRYRLRSIAELTADMISEEIGDACASISNENLWALGAPAKASAAMHLSSSETLREYILFLQNVKAV